MATRKVAEINVNRQKIYKSIKEQHSHHHHHDQRDSFEALEESDAGYKTQVQGPSRNHRHSQNGKSQFMELPKVANNWGSNHSDISSRSRSHSRDYYDTDAKKHVRLAEDKEMPHRHDDSRRKSVVSKDFDDEVHHHHDSKRKSVTSRVEDDEGEYIHHHNRRKSVASRVQVNDDDTHHHHSHHDWRRKSVVSRVQADDDDTHHHHSHHDSRRKSVSPDKENHNDSRRKSTVQNPPETEDKSKDHDHVQDFRRRSVDPKKHEEEERQYHMQMKSPDENYHRHHQNHAKVNIVEAEEEHEKHPGKDTEHHYNHRQRRHSHESDKNGHPHHHKNQLHANKAKKNVAPAVVTFQEIRPTTGHGKSSNDQIIPLLSEGTQTHPRVKQQGVAELPVKVHKKRSDDDLYTPYWESELEKGYEHLKQHRAAYLRAHAPKIETALKPSALSIETDTTLGNSRATVYPGTLPEGVSPGLQCLNKIDRIFFKHQVEIVDGIAVCFDKKKNIYNILNGKGHHMFRMEEEKSHKLCGLCRGLELGFIDSEENEVIRMVKKVELRKSRRKFEMYSPPEFYIGCVEQSWNFRSPQFRIKNVEGTIVMIIKLDGTLCCGFGRSTEMQFMMKTLRGNPRGRLAGDWPDLKRTTFSTEDAYGAHFPGEMNVIWKTLVMGTAFMAYHHYYDGILNREVHHRVGPEARALFDYQLDPTRKSSVSTVPVV